jgi:hypothetical protein
MKHLIKLKHWQLFLLTWGIPLIINIYSFFDTSVLFKAFPIILGLFIFGMLGWVWSIGTGLHKKLPEGIKLKLWPFRLFIFIPILYIIFILLFSINTEVFDGPNGSGKQIGITLLPVIVIIHLISMILLFLGLRFAAKTLKTIEMGRLAHFTEYSQELFLLWFSPIGIWILQPRLNKLAS